MADLLYPFRWLVHNWRCNRWLREVRKGARAMTFQRQHVASRRWLDTGKWPSPEEVTAIVQEDIERTLREQFPRIFASIDRDRRP